MPAHDFASPRLFVEASLGEGGAVEATAAQANYLLNVMRLVEGDGTLLFNGRDGEWRAAIERAGRKRVLLRLAGRTRGQPAPSGLRYLFAPLKHARLDYMVQKAVEMGAGVLQPVMTQHVQASRINVDRMRANVVEAAEQCGILSLSECREPVRLAEILEDFPQGRRLVFCDEREDAASPLDVLQRQGRGPVDLLVGPEGGFSAAEREALRSKPFVTAISLGPRILRADTAAVAALAVVQAAVGDWMPSDP